MTFPDELKALSKLSRSAYPFLTLYLNTRWDSEKQRELVRIFVKTRLRECLSAYETTNGQARQSLERDAESVERYVRGLVKREWDEGYSGIALFSCEGMGVHTLLRSHIPFEEALYCGHRPMVRPAAEQLRLGETAILCAVAGSSGRLLEFELGGLRREFRFQDEAFPGRHEQGGWSQARYQRHVEEHLARNCKTVAEQLVRWVDEKGVKRLLLSGTESDLPVFEQQLPKRILPLVCARIKIDSNAPMNAIQADVEEVLATVNGEESARAVEALFETGKGQSGAASGPESVSAAVTAGKVHVLYLERSFRETGWVCDSCHVVGGKVPPACSSCGGEVELVELGEELVRRTLASDGAVAVVRDNAMLRAKGGVGASVRYR